MLLLAKSAARFLMKKESVDKDLLVRIVVRFLSKNVFVEMFLARNARMFQGARNVDKSLALNKFVVQNRKKSVQQFQVIAFSGTDGHDFLIGSGSLSVVGIKR